MAPEEQDHREEQSTAVGNSAIKWSAIVIIVLAVLYFLAQYIVPLLG